MKDKKPYAKLFGIDVYEGYDNNVYIHDLTYLTCESCSFNNFLSEGYRAFNFYEEHLKFFEISRHNLELYFDHWENMGLIFPSNLHEIYS